MSLIILVKLCTWAIKSFVEERDLGYLPEHSLCSPSQRERRRNRRKGPQSAEIRPREVCLELALGPETEMCGFTLVTGLEKSPQQKQPQTDALLTAVCSYQPQGQSCLIRHFSATLCFLVRCPYFSAA